MGLRLSQLINQQDLHFSGPALKLKIMSELKDKWDLILNLDEGKNITYGRAILKELLSDAEEEEKIWIEHSEVLADKCGDLEEEINKISHKNDTHKKAWETADNKIGELKKDNEEFKKLLEKARNHIVNNADYKYDMSFKNYDEGLLIDELDKHLNNISNE